MNIFAYLDPGTGSVIIQVIIGGILGIGVVLKAYWSKIVSFFNKSKSQTRKSAKKEVSE